MEKREVKGHSTGSGCGKGKSKKKGETVKKDTPKPVPTPASSSRGGLNAELAKLEKRHGHRGIGCIIIESTPEEDGMAYCHNCRTVTLISKMSVHQAGRFLLCGKCVFEIIIMGNMPSQDKNGGKGAGGTGSISTATS